MNKNLFQNKKKKILFSLCKGIYIFSLKKFDYKKYSKNKK